MSLRLAHIVFQTNKLEVMRDFYTALLNATVVFENEMMCFITYDEEHHRVAFMKVPGGSNERPPNSVGLMHAAFTFPDLETLLKRQQELQSKGIEPTAPIQHGPTTSIYYRDPDGCLAELQIDNFDSAQAATDYMHSDAFINDPLGPVFDPDRMYKAFTDGTPLDVLLTREWAAECDQEPPAIARLSGMADM